MVLRGGMYSTRLKPCGPPRNIHFGGSSQLIPTIPGSHNHKSTWGVVGGTAYSIKNASLPLCTLVPAWKRSVQPPWCRDPLSLGVPQGTCILSLIGTPALRWSHLWSLAYMHQWNGIFVFSAWRHDQEGPTKACVRFKSHWYLLISGQQTLARSP